MKLYYLFPFICILAYTACQDSKTPNLLQPISKKSKSEQDSIVDKVFRDNPGHGVYSQEWQLELDKGLAEDSTIARLWQQKAMPFYKQRKYSLGKPFLNKAVQYDRAEFLSYRAFMYCIFSKEYHAAIEDFKACKKEFGDSFVQDHSYDFYIGLCYLQLNEFEKAKSAFEKSIDFSIKRVGEKQVHFLDRMYLGVAQKELKEYEEAIVNFDLALKDYPQFSEAKYYKALCWLRQDKKEEGKVLLMEAMEDRKNGYTINDDNTVYEMYPYQLPQ